MLAIELCVELSSVECQPYLLGGIDSFLQQASFMAITSVRKQKHVAWLQVGVLQRQNSLSTTAPQVNSALHPSRVAQLSSNLNSLG